LPVDDAVLSDHTESGVLLTQHVGYNCPNALPRRRMEVLGEVGLIVAQNTMGQAAGGRVTLTRADTGEAEPLAFDESRSSFVEQMAAFGRAVAGEAHDFDVNRDLALARLSKGAHQDAKQ